MPVARQIQIAGCALLCAATLVACGDAQPKQTDTSHDPHTASASAAAPIQGRKIVVDIRRATKVAGGYRLEAVPSRRYADYSWHDVGASSTYIVPDSVVGTAARSLIGIAALTVSHGKVVALEILGG